MRQDKVIFNGSNPFIEFGKCKELTILLDKNRFVFVATLNSIHMVATFNSTVKVLEGSGSKIREAYTIPLSLIFPLFKLDTQTKDNSLTLETTENKVAITYNGITIETDIFSPNGLTLQQLKDINFDTSLEVNPFPFIRMMEVFGPTKDNFCNVDGKTLFITDDNKCLIEPGEIDYQKKFSMSIEFIRYMKSMKCEKLYIGNNLVAVTKSGVWLVTNLSKITDPNVLLDYKFAAKIKSDNIYTLNINKYQKQINLAVQSVDLSASLDLENNQLILTSNNSEKTIFRLTNKEVIKEGEVDIFGMSSSISDEPIIINDARLIKSLASFGSVRIKVCPEFLLAQLGKTHKLMFTLGRV